MCKCKNIIPSKRPWSLRARTASIAFMLIFTIVSLVSMTGCSVLEEYSSWLPNVGDRAAIPVPSSTSSSAPTIAPTPQTTAADSISSLGETSSKETSSEETTASSPAPLSEKDNRLKILNQSHSHYGYYELAKKLQRCYEDVEQAIFLLKKEFTTPLVSAEELAKVLEYFLQDNPLVYWLGTKYSFKNTLDGNMTVFFTYTDDYDSTGKVLIEVDEAGTRLIGKISDKLPDFDRIRLAHDALVRQVEYDLSAPRQSEAIGALLDSRATCLGYAKAYQYLLSRMGIMALVVYGYAGEGHAWNAVWLEQSYYHIDATWNDRKSESGAHASHAYMLLSDEAISATHSIQKDKSYSIPPCNSQESYFVRRDLVASSDSVETIKTTLAQAIDIAVAEGNVVIEIGFATAEIGKKAQDSFSSGEIDGIIRSLCEARSIPVPIGRYMNDACTVLTYLW